MELSIQDLGEDSGEDFDTLKTILLCERALHLVELVNSDEELVRGPGNNLRIGNIFNDGLEGNFFESGLSSESNNLLTVEASPGWLVNCMIVVEM